MAVLDDIEAHPGTSPGMIGVRLGEKSRSVTHYISVLEKLGMVKRDPAEGCNVRVWPTTDALAVDWRPAA